MFGLEVLTFTVETPPASGGFIDPDSGPFVLALAVKVCTADGGVYFSLADKVMEGNLFPERLLWES